MAVRFLRNKIEKGLRAVYLKVNCDGEGPNKGGKKYYLSKVKSGVLSQLAAQSEQLSRQKVSTFKDQNQSVIILI